MFGLSSKLAAVLAIACGVQLLALAAAGWFILEQREDLGQARAQLDTAIAASEANAALWKEERADRERAQKIVAKLAREKAARDAADAAAKEETYNVPPDQNGLIAPVLRRALDRLPVGSGAGPADAGAGAGDRSDPLGSNAGAGSPGR